MEDHRRGFTLTQPRGDTRSTVTHLCYSLTTVIEAHWDHDSDVQTNDRAERSEHALRNYTVTKEVDGREVTLQAPYVPHRVVGPDE